MTGCVHTPWAEQPITATISHLHVSAGRCLGFKPSLDWIHLSGISGSSQRRRQPCVLGGGQWASMPASANALNFSRQPCEVGPLLIFPNNLTNGCTPVQQPYAHVVPPTISLQWLLYIFYPRTAMSFFSFTYRCSGPHLPKPGVRTADTQVTEVSISSTASHGSVSTSVPR